MRNTLLIIAVLFAAPTMAADGGFKLSRAEIGRLSALAPGNTMELATLPLSKSAAGSVRLKRIDVYAPDAHIFVIDDKGQREVPRSDWAYFIADQKVAGAPLLALGIAPDGKQATGTLFGDDGTYDVSGAARDGDMVLTVVDAESLAPKGTTLKTACGGALGGGFDPLGHPIIDASPVSKAVSVATRQAVLAVDTDNELMSGKFSNNTTTATTYLSALFTAMNVIYERDLNLTLVQGTTFLRVSTTADPFANTDSNATQAQLTEFGTYWQNNQAGVSRVLSMFVSGKSSDAFSASGIAWVLNSGVYCTQRNGVGGGYSVSQVFKFGGSTAANDVQLVAHELGHNFGVNHTHCTSATGAQPTGTGTLDQCFTGEAALGCFAGPQVCPAAASGRTLMSYCHLPSPGGVTCGSVTLAFHPVNITTLLARITTNFPTCVTPIVVTGVIFANGFE